MAAKKFRQGMGAYPLTGSKSEAPPCFSLARIIYDPLRLVDCLPPFSAEAHC